MKKIVVAAALVAACAAAAPAYAQSVRIGPGGISVYTAPPPAPVWRRDLHPYDRRHHETCYRKAHRLNWFERRASADGRLSWWERRELASLQRDLNRTCGGYRWR